MRRNAGRRLPPLRDQRRRHRPAAAHLRRRACPTSTRSTCPTAGSSSPRRASRSTACATGTSWATCSAWTPTARTSTRSARARCTRATRSLLPDGRILYDRWEYVDRNFGDAQGALDRQPRRHEPRGLLGQQHRLARRRARRPRRSPARSRSSATFSSCHDRPWGALAIVDRRLGLDGRAPVRPHLAGRRDRPGRRQGNFDTFTRRRSPSTKTPIRSRDKYFLCSRMTGQGEQMGIYLLDVFGNEILLHAEAPGCFDPMPLGPRAAPAGHPAADRPGQARGLLLRGRRLRRHGHGAASRAAR